MKFASLALFSMASTAIAFSAPRDPNTLVLRHGDETGDHSHDPSSPESAAATSEAVAAPSQTFQPSGASSLVVSVGAAAAAALGAVLIM